MNCCVCDSPNTEVFSIEKVPCTKCGELTELMYNVCRECGAVWKSVDGKVIDCTFAELGEATTIIENMFDIFKDGITDISVYKYNNQGTMSEVVHRCLRCDTVSYEILPNLFHCPECCFEWELL